MPEFFSGFDVSRRHADETCSQFKRIDFGGKNEAWIFY